MNPETGCFEALSEIVKKHATEQGAPLLPGQLVRPNGSPVPEYWSVFKVGEEITIKGHSFRVEYIGETSILFEPVGACQECAAKK